MKFGLLYIPDYYPDRYKSASHYYGEMMEQIQYEEELSFDGVFFAEHYVGGYAFPSPPIFATAMAQKTKRIRLGTGVTLLLSAAGSGSSEPRPTLVSPTRSSRSTSAAFPTKKR